MGDEVVLLKDLLLNNGGKVIGASRVDGEADTLCADMGTWLWSDEKEANELLPLPENLYD
jgi:hypothetical protein